MTRTRDVATQGGLVLISSTTIGSAVSSVTVSNAFSQTYTNYRIVISGMDCSVAQGNLRIQFGTATSGYYGSQYYDLYSSGSGVARNDNGSSLFLAITGVSDNTFSSLDVYGPNISKLTALSGTYYGGGYSGWFAGEEGSSSSHTAFTILLSSGTMTGGTIKVYGYK